MLNIEEISKFYQENMHIYKKQLLREYLQYKILEIIFESKYSKKVVFMGGTAIRIAHDLQRFSEDIDLDCKDMTFEEFKNMGLVIKGELELEGFEIEIRTVSPRAFRCYLKFPGMLYNYGLSGHKREKILIQIDTEKQPYSYQPDEFILNKFSIFTKIFSVPKQILLSQKISAFLNRKRTLGRDIFDIVYLFSFTRPDYSYLKVTNGINDRISLKNVLLEKCNKIDLKTLSDELRVFLINPKDVKVIELFADFIRNIFGDRGRSSEQ